MNLKKTFHREDHRDHEDFCGISSVDDIPANPHSWSCTALNTRPQVDWHSRNNLLAFFVFFVSFVVQLQFQR